MGCRSCVGGRVADRRAVPETCLDDASLDMGCPPRSSRLYGRSGRAALTAGTLTPVGDNTAREDSERDVELCHSDRYDPHDVQRRGAHQLSSTPHRRAVVARSDSAEPEGWESPSRPEAITGHAVTAVSVTPTDHSVETWGQWPAATHEAAGSIPGSAPAGFYDRECERQARLRRWQTIR